MLFRQAFAPLTFTIGFVSGFLFSIFFIVGQVCDYPVVIKQSVADGWDETMLRDAERPANELLGTKRQDTFTQRSAKSSVTATNMNIDGCELVQQGIVCSLLHHSNQANK